jgi:hypothetical protein
MFELERRKRHLEPGEIDINDTVPAQPASSPWAADPVPAEPTVDGTNCGDVMGVAIDDLP